MICQRCRTTLLSRLHFQQYAIRSPSSACLLTGQQNTRLYSSDTPNIHAMPPPPAPRQQGSSSVSVPSAISSATPGVSQPLSTPTQAAHVDIKPSADASKSAKPAVEREPSSCVAGTKLNGLNYMKNKPGVFALEDSEYPDWLWGLLDSSKTQTKTELGGVDPSTLNRKQRKRYARKMAALEAALPRQIPLHEQATDLTPATYNRSDDVSQDFVARAAASLDQREAITKSSRDARRKEIRESNYLRGL